MEPHVDSISSKTPTTQNFKRVSAAWPMLTPVHAWRLLCRRTGGRISLTTFYRWINSGRIGAVRLGMRFLVPLPVVEEAIQKCLDGERI